MTMCSPVVWARPASHAGSRPTPGGVRSTRAVPPEAPVVLELGRDDLGVAGQLPVVPAARDVPERDRRVLVRERESEGVRRDIAEDGADMRHGRKSTAWESHGRATVSG